MAVSDDAGDLVSTQAFYPFGELRTSSSLFDTERGFTGQIADPDTGLNFYNARYQDPVLGRFISPDSIVPNPNNPALYNRFSYVQSNPLAFVDPTGFVCSYPGEFDSCDSNDGDFELSFTAYSASNYLGGYLDDAPKFWSVLYSPIAETVHASLDVAGFVPVVGEIADGVNAALYLAEGDLENAALSAVALVPVLGSAATAARTADRVAGVVKNAELGRAGEAAAGITKNTEHITPATGANYRIPDGLDHSLKVIQEVKNVKSLSLTKQMNDFIKYAKNNDYTLQLFVRRTTKISGPLVDALSHVDHTITYID